MSHFPSIPFVLRSMPAFANVPSIAAQFYAREFGLGTAPTPFESPTFDVSLIWSSRVHNDAAVTWLRQQIADVVTELVKTSATPARKGRQRR